MSNTKVLISALFLSLLPYVSCQSEPNDTIYIPGISLIASELGTPTAPVAVSQVTVDGATTVFQIVDALPTAAGGDLTATLDLSPSGAHLSAAVPGIGPIDITCSIAGDSSCQLAVPNLGTTSSFTEATSGVPVVAVGVASSSGSGSGSSTPTSTPTASGSGSTAVSTPGSSSSQTGGSSATPGSSSSGSPSSSTGSSGSQTAPAAAASTTQPSSAMGLRSSMVTILIGFSLVMASL